jgi:hypothetical protein
MAKHSKVASMTIENRGGDIVVWVERVGKLGVFDMRRRSPYKLGVGEWCISWASVQRAARAQARKDAIVAAEVAALKAAFANWPADGIVKVGVYVDERVAA